jgi:hypothetical protein
MLVTTTYKHIYVIKASTDLRSVCFYLIVTHREAIFLKANKYHCAIFQSNVNQNTTAALQDALFCLRNLSVGKKNRDFNANE